MIERTEGQQLFESIAVIGIIVLGIAWYFLSSGLIVINTPEPPPVPVTIVPTPTPEIITPEPTPTPVQTLEPAYVDPYEQGQRSQGQWFKWYRADVTGLKDLDAGVIVYRSMFLDRYTWYNPVWANYFTQRPRPGMRYFVVWVHEEIFGVNQSDDPRMWGFDESAFRLQVKDQVIDSELNQTYNPVIRIREFDHQSTYYDTVTAPPFSYYVRYTGQNPETGGFAAERLGWIRMGRENGFDGYIIYEIPKETKIEDISLLGDFATFGSAQWTFPR